MNFRKIVLFAGFVFLLAMLSACIDGSSRETNNEEGPETETAPETSGDEKIVNIGYSGPLSGAAADYGEKTLNGLKLAVDEINEHGFEVNGETYKINLVALDDKYLPGETASKA